MSIMVGDYVVTTGTLAGIARTNHRNGNSPNLAPACWAPLSITAVAGPQGTSGTCRSPGSGWDPRGLRATRDPRVRPAGKGETGAKGAQGPAGPKGDAGVKGDAGPEG